MKEYTKDEIKKLITTNKAWTEHAILALYKLQTDDEQETLHTKHENGVGFNGMDAPFLSDLARQLLHGWHLSDRQLNAAQRLISKYAGQLTKIANREPYRKEKLDGKF